MSEVRKKISKVTYDRNKGVLHFELLDKKFQLGPISVGLIQKILEGKIDNAQRDVLDILKIIFKRENDILCIDRTENNVTEKYDIECNVLAKIMGIKESLYQQNNSSPLLFSNSRSFANWKKSETSVIGRF